jgi:tRNA threonylcarbamoyladenosine biosynthesis protein TsaE
MTIENLEQMMSFGEHLGRTLRGGETIELIGDVGTGKTTLTKGIARGLDIDEDVQSPSFTISRTYEARNGLEMHHYDFYRLSDPGIMRYELAESIEDSGVVTVVEWADSVEDVLPSPRVTVRLHHTEAEGGRELQMDVPETFNYVRERV